jgi:flagellar hook-basal body complex protein FliE
MSPIQGVSPIVSPFAVGSPLAVERGARGASFAVQLESAVDTVSLKANAADDAVAALAAGEDVDNHTSMIALSEAEVTLKMMVAVRDRAVEAYQHIMNMQI